jgi:hypothetical protein
MDSRGARGNRKSKRDAFEECVASNRGGSAAKVLVLAT